MKQQTLFTGPNPYGEIEPRAVAPTQPRREIKSDARKRTIQERFESFNAEFPEVYQLFKRFALELRDAGIKKYGAKSIMERIRWHRDVETAGEGGFKINDHFTSRYVRKLIEDLPAFKDFFEVRVLHTA